MQQQGEHCCLGDHSQGRSGDGGHPAVQRALHQGHRQRGIPCKYQIATGILCIMKTIAGRGGGEMAAWEKMKTKRDKMEKKKTGIRKKKKIALKPGVK